MSSYGDTKTNLVINGGFEFPVLGSTKYISLTSFSMPFGGWSMGSSLCISGTDQPNINLVSKLYWDSAEGMQSIDMSGDGDTAPYISQIITTVIDESYTLSWQESANYEAGWTNNVSYQLRIPSVSFFQNYTVIGNSQRNAKNMMYFRQSIKFKAIHNETLIRFDSCSNTGRGAVLDDISIIITDLNAIVIYTESRVAIIGGIIGGIVGFAALLFGLFLFCRKKRKRSDYFNNIIIKDYTQSKISSLFKDIKTEKPKNQEEYKNRVSSDLEKFHKSLYEIPQQPLTITRLSMNNEVHVNNEHQNNINDELQKENTNQKMDNNINQNTDHNINQTSKNKVIPLGIGVVPHKVIKQEKVILKPVKYVNYDPNFENRRLELQKIGEYSAYTFTTQQTSYVKDTSQLKNKVAKVIMVQNILQNTKNHLNNG